MASQLMYSSGHRPSPAELASWSGSLPILAHDLSDAGLTNVEVLLEYKLPLTSKRADVVLAGNHPRTGSPSYVVVELKQWSRVEPSSESPELVDVPGMPGGPKRTPGAQVADYCQYLRDFLAALDTLEDPLAGAAYLHNAGHDARSALSRYPQTSQSRVFTGSDRGEFLDFLTSRLDGSTSGAPAADLLLRSKVKPSKQLLSVAADEIAGREQFVLLDEQRVAVEVVLDAVERSHRSDFKSVVIVTGGPGSGKSVVALSLMGQLAARGRTAIHATGSKSFTTTLRQVTGSRSKNLFKYFNQFMDAERNGLDVLILDEAHRIRETLANRYTRAHLRTGRPQVEELIAAARVPVFLLDQHQVVRPGELGTVEDIASAAQSAGLQTTHVSLDTQFRCGGSEKYIDWVQRLLGFDGEQPTSWTPDPPFSLDVVDTPVELQNRLAVYRENGYFARMTAGYCWPWSDPRNDKTLVPDVVIGEWSRPWNSRAERRLPGAPTAALWATEPEGFDQVGCVYTAQGFEYDWNGVIFGPDLVWRTDRWVARREFNKDPDFRSRTAVSDEKFERLVRNVYKVLLTRGMIGTLVYSTDQETRDFLHSLMT